MDSQVYVHDEYDRRGDITPEVVSRELDNVIQSYETSNDHSYMNESFEKDGKSNGNPDLIKKKRRKELPNDMTNDKENLHREREIEDENETVVEWSRTSKDYLKIILIIFTILTFVLNVGPFKRFQGNPLFNQTRGEVSRKFPLPITPIREVFVIIWPIIYVFQGLWMGLCLVSIFTKTKRIKFVEGRERTELTYLHRSPNVFPVPMLIFYALGQISITAYKFSNDREELLYSVISLGWACLFFHFSLIFAVKGLHDSIDFLTPDLVEIKYDKLLTIYKWMLRLQYINGIAILATWQIIAASLSLCKYLLYGLLWRPELASAVAICVLIFYAIFFFVFDVFVVNQPSKWIYTSYGALIAAFVGCLVKLWLPRKWSNTSQVTKMQVIFLVIIIVCVSLFKVGALIARAAKKRKKKNQEIDTLVQNGMNNY